MVLLVILKCNSNLSFLINPHFHALNWHLQVLIVQKEIQYQCPHSKLFANSGLVFECLGLRLGSDADWISGRWWFQEETKNIIIYSTRDKNSLIKICLLLLRFVKGHKVTKHILERLKTGKDIYVYMNIIITKKNFGLIQVYFLYTVFRATYIALISKVTWLIDYQ